MAAGHVRGNAPACGRVERAGDLGKGAGLSPADITPTSRQYRLFWAKLAQLQRHFPLLQILALIALFAYGAATLPGLASWPSIKSILVLAALIGLASAGQTLLILMGGFDLSVSGFIVAGALVVSVLKDKWGVSFVIAILIAVVSAGILGAIAGQICHRFAIQPLVVTLATGAIAIGLVQTRTGGLTSGSAPEWLAKLTSPATKTFGLDVPPLVAIWALIAALLALFIHRTTRGRQLLATGANRGAADHSLINTRTVWTATFAFSAIASTLVGVLIGGFAGTVDGTIGDPYLFQSIVAVVVGGTVFGGPGDYTWTVVGALFLTVLNVVLVGHGATLAYQDIIYGLVVLLAVAIYGRERRLPDRI